MLNSFIQKYSAPLVLSGMFIIALFSFREYGLAWDENAQEALGLVTWNYIFNGDTTLLTTADTDHGVAFELFLVFIEKVFGLTDLRNIFLMRHLLSHLFFLVGGYACYKLADLLYQNKLLSLLALLLFLLHPHIYAHSFFNTKDIPFLSMCMISFYLSAKMFQKKDNKSALFLGLAMGLLINMRLMGILLLGAVIFILFLDALREKKWIFHLKITLIFLITTAFALYVSWPYLWTDPLHHFYLAFKSMSRYSWPLTNFINGKQVAAKELSWNYIPIWFSITTPIIYLLTGFAGILAAIYVLLKKPLVFFESFQGKVNFLFLTCFFAPVLAVIILKSVLYDGWRHLFFIYPSFVMLAVYGLHLLSRFKKPLVAFVFAGIACVAVFMVQNAPFQHVYFNGFVNSGKPEELRKNYDLDYWGTSYFSSLNYILKTDTAKLIKVCAANDAAEYNIKLIPENNRYRIAFTPLEQADYFISNYRWHPEDYPFEDKKVFSVKVENNTINAVYKLK